MKMPPEICPNCGAEVPRHARACPACGADDGTGWSEEAYTSSLGLPDESFDYDEFVKRELEPKKESTPLPRGIKPGWWVVAIILVLALLGLVLRGLF